MSRIGAAILCLISAFLVSGCAGLDDDSSADEVRSRASYYQNDAPNKIRDKSEAERAARYDYLMDHNKFAD